VILSGHWKPHRSAFAERRPKRKNTGDDILGGVAARRRLLGELSTSV
jgi:hypothetical protein